MISTFVFEQNAKFEALQASLEKPKLREFIKCALIMQLPEQLQSVIRNVEHFHVCLFFIWKHYYQISMRITRVRYSKEKQTVTMDYLRPGRLIMAQVLISTLVFLWKLIKSVRRAYQLYNQQLAVWRQSQTTDFTNPQECSQKEEPTDELQAEIQQTDANTCALCYGTRSDTTATSCGHLFCWTCINRSLMIKLECPNCREICQPNELVLISNL